MFTDHPIEQINDDKLGRSIFAKEIADGLVNSFDTTRESVVVGITGPWGSGKTSLVNLIVQQVESLAIAQDKKIVILRFNPWMFSGQRELQEIFLTELFLKLHGLKGKIKSVSEKLAKLTDYFTWLKYVHSGAGKLVADSQKLFNRISEKKELSSLKKELDDALIESKVKLYITIDDIDRLTPAEINHIFQLVKLNGNFANTFFILIYDQEVVVKALEGQFKENGRKYLEKIVQVDYSVPRITKKKISSIFLESMDSIFADKKIINAIKEGIPNLSSEKFIESFTSMRDVYRFCNAIKLRLRSIYGELNIRDFFVIETLRLFHYKVYEFVLESKTKLTQEDHIREILELDLENEKTPPVEQIIKDAAFDKHCQMLLKGLFVLEGVLDRRSPESLIAQRSIANRNYFDRYFNMQLSDQDIPEEMFNNFILVNDLNARIRILKEIEVRRQLYHFLKWIEIKLKHQQPTTDVSSIILTVFSFSNSIHWSSPRNFGPSDLLTVHRFCSKMLDYVGGVGLRRQIIFKYLNELAQPAFSSVHLCGEILRAKGKFDEDKLGSDHLWFDLFAAEMKGKMDGFEEFLLRHASDGTKSLFLKALLDDKFLSDDELVVVLEQLSKFHKKVYDSEFPKFIEKRDVLLRILLICISFRSVSYSGSPRRFSLSRSQFYDKMDVSKIYQELSTIDREGLNKVQIKTIDFFLKAFSDGFQEKLYYAFDDLNDVVEDR